MGLALMAALLGGTLFVPARAEFSLVENFDGLAAGGVDGQNGWSASHPRVDVRSAASARAVGKVLESGADQTGACRRVPVIADGTTGTLFCRFCRTSDDPNSAIALADGAVSNSGYDWQSCRPIVGYGPGGIFQVRDGARYLPVHNVTLAGHQWYDLWIVVDNRANTYRAYVKGAGVENRTQLLAASGGTFAFRDSESGSADLEHFVTATGSDSLDGGLLLDDIYVDPFGENLSDPRSDLGRKLLLIP